MTNATLPIHPKFSLVINQYVQSSFLTKSCPKLSNELVYSYLCNGFTTTTTQILMFLYVLTYNDYIIAFRTEPKLMALASSSVTALEQKEYTVDDSFPIRYILNCVEGEPAYRTIYPDMIALSANLYPELFDITSFLLQEGKQSELEALWDTKTINKEWIHSLPPNELKGLLEQWGSNPTLVINVLLHMQTLSVADCTDHIDRMLSTLLEPCLEGKLDSQVADTFISTWEAFNCTVPYTLWEMTINHIAPKEYTINDLIQDPHIIFKCDPRVFRSERLLTLWLHVLSCLRTTSKHRIWKRYHTVYPHRSTTTTDANLFNSRNVLALTNAQDTLMLQLLLELCLQKETDHEDALKESRKLICNFIHSIFIDGDRDMLLAKILHFQTYSTDLIPMMVEMIPSLYIVMSFIPELTRQPQVEKQVFGILIACQLCEKYPLKEYLITAEKHVLPRLLRIAFPVTREGQPSNVCVPSEFLVKAIPGFVSLAKAFPHFGPTILKAFNGMISF
ncbi:unnamed protein product [Mucor hiemalis]